jgi:hypothetical protein
MLFHIDVADSHLSGIDQGILYRLGLSDQTDNQAVMVLIRTVIKKITPISVPKASDNGVNHLLPSAFTEIGNAFDQLSRHGRSSP